jgi:hypothetical protein
VFLGGVSYSTTEESLRGYLEKFGEVLSVVIMTDRNTGRPRGFGFATFADEAAIQRVTSEPHIIDGRMVEAKVATPVGSTVPRGLTEEGGPLPINTKKIFVGGLPPSITNENFKEHFDQFGLIDNAIVMVDRMTERSRGFGFVTFANAESVATALAETHTLDGKQVEVKSCFAKQKNRGWKGGQAPTEREGGHNQPRGSGKARRNGRNSNQNQANQAYAAAAEGYGQAGEGYGSAYNVAAGNYQAGNYPEGYTNAYAGAPYTGTATGTNYMTSPYEQYKGYMYGVYQQQMIQNYGNAYTPQQGYASMPQGSDPSAMQRPFDPSLQGGQETQVRSMQQQMVGPAGEGEANCIDQLQSAGQDSPGRPIGMPEGLLAEDPQSRPIGSYGEGLARPMMAQTQRQA